MQISGTTRVVGILADPIAQVRTPSVLNARMAAEGTDGVVVPIHVSAADLETVWRGLARVRSLAGMIVTVPHKQAVARLADETATAVRQVGAANVVRREPDGRMVAAVYDGVGFVAGLQAEGHDPAGKAALQVGAGGAGAAIAVALADAGVASLRLANRTEEKAQDLARRVADAYPGCRVEAGPADPAGFDLVVNATSLGMGEADPLPVPLEALSPGTLVAEVIMKPEKTALLHQAEARGCPIHLGRHMLDQQARLLLEFLGLSARA